MSRYKRIILLAGFFSFIGVGFSNGLLFKKNTLVEEVIEYDEVVRKVKKVQRKPASIHSKRHKTVVTAGELPFAKEIANPEVQSSDRFAANNETFEDHSISGSTGGNSASPSQTYYPQSLGQGIPTGPTPSYTAPTVASSLPTTGSSSVNLGGGGGMSFGNVNTGDSNSNQGSGVSIYKVQAIQLKSGKLIVQGSNLHTVKNITLKSSNGSIALSKVSASSSELVAMGFDALKLITGKVYSLIIADAYGSSTYPISIELADGAVTMRKLAPLGASEDGYILKWDASSQSWVAAPDEVGAGPDGGITSITKGTGIVGQGASITTVGSIAVDVGSNEGQIPQFNADKKLVLQSDNRISFTENAEEFVFGMFAEVFKLRNQTNDTDIFAVVGNDFLVRGQQVCLSDGTNCPAAGAAIESISVSAPLTQSGTTSVSLGLAIDNATIGLNGSSQLSIPNAAITANKLHQMGAAPNQVLKWNGATWAPAADVDTGITAEADPYVRNFARTDVGAPPTCAADQSWTHDIMLDIFVCRDIQIDPSQVTGLDLHWESIADSGIKFAGTGNIGIGVDTPTSKLEVNGEIKVIQQTPNSYSRGLVVAKRGAPGDELASVVSGAELGYHGFSGWDGTAMGRGAFVIARTTEAWTPTAHGASYAIHTTANGSTTNTQRMIINHNGNVGLGQGTPNATIHTSKTAPLGTISSTGSAVTGVGTNFTASLSVGDKIVANRQVRTISSITDATNLTVSSSFSSDLVAGTSYTRVGAILDSGYVGIGTVNPTTHLEVNGIVKATAFEGPMTSSSVSSGTGTATAPAYTFSNSTNTGFFSTSAGSIGISSAGTQTFNFNSYGLLSTTVGGASVNSANGTAGSPTFSFAGDADTGWFRPSVDTMAASTGGSERMRIDSAGRVGIGTTNAEGMLQIGGDTSAGDLIFKAGSAATGDAGDIIFKTNAGAQIGRIWTETITGGLIFTGRTSNSPDIFLSPSGNIGVGTTAPSHKLHVVDGKIAVSGADAFYQVGTDSNDNNLGKISFHGTSNKTTQRYWTGIAYSNGNGSMSIGGGDSLNLNLDSGSSGSYGSHIFRKVGWDGTNRTFSESMRIDPTGKVGIGTTTPEAGLHVQTPRWGTDTNPPQLGIVGSRAAIGFYDNNQTGANVFVLENGEQQFHLYSTTHTANDWGYDEKVSRLTVLGANGNVGIGVTSPTTKLEVDGIIKATGFQGPMTSTSVSSGTGTAAAPAYTFSNSTDTGFFSSSVGSIGISSGGAQTFNFNSYGLLSTTVGGASINSANGTAGSPTFSFSGDADTGWFRPAADTMAASTGGVERVRIQSNGYLGVGTTLPANLVEISRDSATPNATNSDANNYINLAHLKLSSARSDGGNALYLGTTDDYNGRTSWIQAGHKTASYATSSSDSELLLQPFGGKIGVGVLVPTYPLDVAGDIRSTTRLRVGSGDAGITTAGNDITLRDALNNISFRGTRSASAWSPGLDSQWFQVGNASDAITFSTAGGTAASRMKMTTSSFQVSPGNGTNTPTGLFEVSNNTTGLFNILLNGNTGVGVTAPSEKLEVNGNVKAQAYLYTSDARLKKNVKTYDNALIKILALRGVKFDWIENDEHEVGFIAQEVEEIEPNLVVTSSVDGIKAVKYANMVAILVEAFKEQNKVIEENKKLFLTMHAGLESRVKTLEREVASLREENEKLKEDLELIKKHLKIK